MKALISEEITVSYKDFEEHCSKCFFCTDLSSMEEKLARYSMFPEDRPNVRIRCAVIVQFRGGATMRRDCKVTPV